ncbi:MAG TPA: hypothetical protein VMV09_06005, partial [Candidatus Saccharimonadales bacterium]|nr:hypothetical protein [Candidatus Saccharimonadales bacterium]
LGSSTTSPTPSPNGGVLAASTPLTGAGLGVWGGAALLLVGTVLLGAAAIVRRRGFLTAG